MKKSRKSEIISDAERDMNDNITDVVTTQDTIIRMQSKVISKLFLQLLQYTSAEELDHCGIVAEINEIAKLRN